MVHITNRGLLWITKAMYEDTSANMTRMQLGTAGAADAATDTSLNTPTAASGFMYATATCSNAGTYPTSHISQWTHTWTATGTIALTEIGIFNSDWWMLLRHYWSSAKNLVATETLTVTIQITHTAV